MRRFFREVYMDSVFPILNSAELPPYIWGNDEREKVRILSSQFQNNFCYSYSLLGCFRCQLSDMLPKTVISVP